MQENPPRAEMARTPSTLSQRSTQHHTFGWHFSGQLPESFTPPIAGLGSRPKSDLELLRWICSELNDLRVPLFGLLTESLEDPARKIALGEAVIISNQVSDAWVSSSPTFPMEFEVLGLSNGPLSAKEILLAICSAVYNCANEISRHVLPKQPIGMQVWIAELLAVVESVVILPAGISCRTPLQRQAEEIKIEAILKQTHEAILQPDSEVE